MALLRRDRSMVIAGLAGTIALSWAWLVPAALDMYGDMDGLAAWMMRADWSVRYGVLMALMWSVMMVGMMLPSAAPTILTFATIVARSPEPQAPLARTYAFAAGYLLAWAAFSVAATLLQWQLAERALLSPMMEPARPALAGAILIAAGVYQWTPLKQACLSQCRSPLDYLSQHWRSGVAGAVRMGFGHGLYCIGCCWALMLLLFAGGVMSLAVIGAITLFVLLEKVAPLGGAAGRIAGGALVGAGVLALL